MLAHKFEIVRVRLGAWVVSFTAGPLTCYLVDETQMGTSYGHVWSVDINDAQKFTRHAKAQIALDAAATEFDNCKG